MKSRLKPTKETTSKIILWVVFIILVAVCAAILLKAPKDRMVYPVVKVVDGDTIDVDVFGTTARVRLIGIDTPETVDPSKPVQCFGQEATDKAKELLTNQKVRLQSDPSQSDIDEYGRMLRYVFLSDNTNVNELMIAQGYAHEYTYKTPYMYQEEFKQAEKNAQDQGLGLWAPGVCDHQ